MLRAINVTITLLMLIFVGDLFAAQEEVDFEATLKGHVEHLATTIGERNLLHHAALGKAADYIEEQFKT